jgi:hypothetical protein
MAGDKKEIIGEALLAEPKTLRVATLGAIVEAIKNPGIFGDTQNLAVQVVSPTEVRIVSPSVGEERQQFVYVQAIAETSQPAYKQFVAIDEFIIGMLVLTGNSPDRARLLDYVGSLSAGLATGIVDDGASQTTTTNRGITRAGLPTRFENPQQGEALTAQAALFEADGGAWKLKAITDIGDWLRTELPEKTVVLS